MNPSLPCPTSARGEILQLPLLQECLYDMKAPITTIKAAFGNDTMTIVEVRV